MSRPLRINYPGAFYHVTSRGNERKNVFKSERDRQKFLEYLESATICHRYTGEKLKMIGTHFGIGESGVSQASRRVAEKMRNDKKLRGKIAKIEIKLKLSRM